LARAKKGLAMTHATTRDQIAAALCAVITAALPAANRTIKSNAPNFELAGRDLITLNVPPTGPVRVVFHRGAKARDSKTGTRLVDDRCGRLTWATDQRASAGFADLASALGGAAWLADFSRARAAAVLSAPG
jgi:hypothetical protein